MRNSVVYISLLVFLFSCREVKKEKIHTLQFSSSVDSLVNDTISYGSIVDSFRIELKNACCDSVAIDWLNKLAYTWKGQPIMIFASEALKQSEKINYRTGKAIAIGHQGYAFYWNYQEDSALKYYNRALQILTSKSDQKAKAQITSYIGDVHRVRLQHQEALEKYHESMKLAKESGDEERMAMLHSVIADIYRLQNSFDSSLSNYHRAVELSKKTKDYKRLGFCYAYIGDIYRLREEHVKALEHFNLALNLANKTDDKNIQAYVYMNKGEVYKYLMEPDSAMNNYLRSQKLAESINDNQTILSCLGSIGMLHTNLGNVNEALKYYKKMLHLAREQQEVIAQVNALINIGEYHRKFLKNFDSALVFYNEALGLSEKVNFSFGISRLLLIRAYTAYDEKRYVDADQFAKHALKSALKFDHTDITKEAYRILSISNENAGNYKEAFLYNKLYRDIADSLLNNEQIKRFASAEYKNTERNLVSLHQQKEKLHKAEKAQKDEEIKRQRFVRNTFIGGFVVIAVFSVLLFRSLRANKKAKKMIEHQKEIVEEKQKEIIDSIKYARRIQNALLPPDKYLERFLKKKQ